MKSCLAHFLVGIVFASADDDEKYRDEGDKTECVGRHLLGEKTFGLEVVDLELCKAMCEKIPDCSGFNQKFDDGKPSKCTFWVAEVSGSKEAQDVKCWRHNDGGFDRHDGVQCAGAVPLKRWKKTGKKDDCTDDDKDTGINDFGEFLDLTATTNGDLTSGDADAQRESELTMCKEICGNHTECAGFEVTTVPQRTNKTAPKVTKCSFWQFGDLKKGAEKEDVDCHIKTSKRTGPCAAGGSAGGPAGGSAGGPAGGSEEESGEGTWQEVVLNVPIQCPQQIRKEVQETRTIDVPVPYPVTRHVDVPCPVPTPVQVPVPVTQTVHVRVPVPNVIDRPVPTPVTVQVQVPNPVPTPVPNPVPCPVPQTIHQRVAVPVFVDRVVDVPVPVPVPVPLHIQAPPQPMACTAPACGSTISVDADVSGVHVAGPAMPYLG